MHVPCVSWLFHPLLAGVEHERRRGQLAAFKKVASRQNAGRFHKILPVEGTVFTLVEGTIEDGKCRPLQNPKRLSSKMGSEISKAIPNTSNWSHGKTAALWPTCGLYGNIWYFGNRVLLGLSSDPFRTLLCSWYLHAWNGSRWCHDVLAAKCVRGVVCCSPVHFQVLSQVLTGILQLVLIQDHVKEFLREGVGEPSTAVRKQKTGLNFQQEDSDTSTCIEWWIQQTKRHRKGGGRGESLESWTISSAKRDQSGLDASVSWLQIQPDPPGIRLL